MRLSSTHPSNNMDSPATDTDAESVSGGGIDEVDSGAKSDPIPPVNRTPQASTATTVDIPAEAALLSSINAWFQANENAATPLRDLSAAEAILTQRRREGRPDPP